MKQIKIVADSSANLFHLDKVPFQAAPLRIVTDEKEYVDEEVLNVAEMVADLKQYKGRSTSACPGTGDWLDAFGDAEQIICLTLTGTISGSYNAACLAKREYEEEFPERQVFVINTLSTGPEMHILIEKIQEWILADIDFEKICEQSAEYVKSTGLVFILESLTNFANNGRVSPAVAKTAGLLGIRIVGQASEQGDLEILDKCRGGKKALATAFERVKQAGYKGGKIKIAHCYNEEAARQLRDTICQEFENADIEIYPTGGLCSFYAEQGGMLIGFDKTTSLV